MESLGKNTTEKRERFDQPPFTLIIMKPHHGSTTINHLRPSISDSKSIWYSSLKENDSGVSETQWKGVESVDDIRESGYQILSSGLS